MIVKLGDVLEYNNGMYGLVIHVTDDGAILDLSDGTSFTITRSQILMGISKGNIKYKSFKKDEISPSHWFYSKFKF